VTDGKQCTGLPALHNKSVHRGSHQTHALLQMSAAVEVGETGGFGLSKQSNATTGHRVVFHDCHNGSQCVRERGRGMLLTQY